MFVLKSFTHLLVTTIIIPPGVPVAPLEPIHAPEQSTETTVWEEIQADAQNFTITGTANIEPLERGKYSATTIEEVQAIQTARAKAEAAAKEAAEKAAAEAAEKAEQQLNRTAVSNVTYSQTNPECSTTYCWPVNNFTYNPEINSFRPPERPTHKGFDFMAPALTPIYAAVGGTVTLSSDHHYDFGAAVVVTSVVDGQQVQMTYAHMTYGTQKVQAGDTVQAGQILGQVGMTGAATANHLHLEVRVNGTPVDPYGWLQQHAG